MEGIRKLDGVRVGGLIKVSATARLKNVDQKRGEEKFKLSVGGHVVWVQVYNDRIFITDSNAGVSVNHSHNSVEIIIRKAAKQ